LETDLWLRLDLVCVAKKIKKEGNGGWYSVEEEDKYGE
jgi:hypothetical protein